MPFFLPAIAAMFGGGAAATATTAATGAGTALTGAAAPALTAGAGAAAMGVGGSALAGASSAGAPAAAEGFSWSKFGDKFSQYAGGDDSGDSPLRGLADFGDIMDQRNMQPVQSIPHQVPGGAPITNPGLFGLQNLTANLNRGGWGR